MNSMKYFPFFILILATGCFNGNKVNILEGGCPENQDQAFSITDSDGMTEMCLITDLEQDVLSWNWSADGSMLAFAVHDTTITRPAIGGKYGGYVPPTTNWYIANRDGGNLQRYSLADNKKLRLSPDGKYAIIRERCIDLTCRYSVYKMKTQQKVCQYSVYTLLFRDSDCGNLTLKNGVIWELKEEVNEEACKHYGLGVEIEGCPPIRTPPGETLSGTPAPSGYPPPFENPLPSYP